MSRSEYTANQQLANSKVDTTTKAVVYAPADYITGPVIRSESEKPSVKLGDVNDSSTWRLV